MIQNTMQEIVEEHHNKMVQCCKEAEKKKENEKNESDDTDKEDNQQLEWKVVHNKKRQKKADTQTAESTTEEVMETKDEKDTITSVNGDKLYSDGKLLWDKEIPYAPRVIGVPTSISFYDKKAKARVETYAFEIQCNRLEMTKVAETLNSQYKVYKTCIIIPYGMKHEDQDQYFQWIVMQNTFLEESVRIPLFGLHPDLLDNCMHQTDKRQSTQD